ncbi:MAG: MFS transporter [Deltaproteobacteria bacterium]|nr:MFS transporter [Deltaproteobacteria bacterium]
MNRSGGAMAPGRARQVATTAVILALVVSALEGTVVTTAMPTITEALGGRAHYAWVFTAFLLASTLGVMLAGKLADQLGRKPVFLGGVALFLAGSALCGIANGMTALIAFRALQGLGAGVIQPTTMTITADLYTLEERAKMQAVITAFWGLANVLGPVLGGLIVGHMSWRWVFLVNLPVGALAALLLAKSYRDPARVAERADIVGPVLGGLATALALLALERETSLVVRLALLVGALALGTAFWKQQQRAPVKVVPFQHLRDRNVQAGLVGGAFAGALLYSTSAYVPLWMTGRGHGALTAGFALVPMLACWAVGSSAGVVLLLRGGMRLSVGAALAVCAMGAALLAGCALSEPPLVAVLVALGIFGFGLGPAASTSTIGPQSVVPWQARGAVTSVIYAARMLGGAVAVALLDLARAHPAWQVALIAPVAAVGAATLLALAPGPARDAATAEVLPALD